jgi:hypothetical protein
MMVSLLLRQFWYAVVLVVMPMLFSVCTSDLPCLLALCSFRRLSYHLSAHFFVLLLFVDESIRQ